MLQLSNLKGGSRRSGGSGLGDREVTRRAAIAARQSRWVSVEGLMVALSLTAFDGRSILPCTQTKTVRATACMEKALTDCTPASFSSDGIP